MRHVSFNQTFGQSSPPNDFTLNRQELTRDQYPPQVLNSLEPGYGDHPPVIDSNTWDNTNIPKPILITPGHPKAMRPQPDPRPEFDPKGKPPPQ